MSALQPGCAVLKGEAALARTIQLDAYGDPPSDMASLAAAYAYGIAMNHPFAEGNKRTRLIVRTFLLLNGQDLEPLSP